jgi:hypothetical protein
MSGQLRGKCILITGGAQGIGRECVRAYVRESARVAILDIAAEASEQAVMELGSSVISVHCDVAEGGSVAAAIAKVIKEFGAIDAVHNNAGISSPSKPLHLTEEEVGPIASSQPEVSLLDDETLLSLSQGIKGRDLEHCEHGRLHGAVRSCGLCRNEGRNDRIDQGNGSGLRGRRCTGQCSMSCRSLDPDAATVGERAGQS